MTPKEDLMRVKRYYDLIHDTESEIKMLQIQKDGMSGMRYDKDRVQTSLYDTGLENLIIQIEQKSNRLIDLKEEYLKIRASVTDRIMKIRNERERKVLILRYLDFKEWEQVFQEMDGTPDIVFSLHKRALNHYKC